jgi:hypothetical protein
MSKVNKGLELDGNAHFISFERQCRLRHRCSDV